MTVDFDACLMQQKMEVFLIIIIVCIGVCSIFVHLMA